MRKTATSSSLAPSCHLTPWLLPASGYITSVYTLNGVSSPCPCRLHRRSRKFSRRPTAGPSLSQILVNLYISLLGGRGTCLRVISGPLCGFPLPSFEFSGPWPMQKTPVSRRPSTSARESQSQSSLSLRADSATWGKKGLATWNSVRLITPHGAPHTRVSQLRHWRTTVRRRLV